MTESFKNAIEFTIIRSSHDHDSKRTISRSDVVLISFANDDYYLTVPQKIDELTGQIVYQEALFQNWKDSNNKDLNSWWTIEFTSYENQIKLKHFNTGKYLMKAQDSEYTDSSAAFILTSESYYASAFTLENVTNTKTQDVNDFIEGEAFHMSLS